MTHPRQADHPIDPMFIQRWSPRAFTGEPMPREALMSLFEAARWAPSAYNAQPWRFAFGIAGTPAFDKLLATLMPFNQSWAAKASALVAVISAQQFMQPGHADPQDLGSHAFDAGAAWASLALQAHKLGWYTHGMGGFDRLALRTALALPDVFVPQAVVAIGRLGDPAQLPEALRQREVPSPRRPLGELVVEASGDGPFTWDL